MTKSKHKKWWNSLTETWKDQFILNLFASNSIPGLGLASAEILQFIDKPKKVLDAIVNLKDVTVLQSTKYDLSSLAYLENIEVIRFIEPIHSTDNVNAIVTTTPKHLRSKVKRLCISNTSFGNDLSIFSDFSNLEYLNCFCCELKSLSGVEKLKKLKWLQVGFNDFSDLNPLRGLNLIELSIGTTKVNDISPLLDIPSLKFLELHKLKLNSYAPLLVLPNLERVCLGDAVVENRADLVKYLDIKLQLSAKQEDHRKRFKDALNLPMMFMPHL